MTPRIIAIGLTGDPVPVAAVAVVAGHDALAHRLGRRTASAAVRFGAAAAALAIARGAGISWAELGLGRNELSRGVRTGAVAGACAAGAVFAGAAWPGTRSLFLDERAAPDRDGGLAAELARITLAAVPAEELTYRSALLAGCLAHASAAHPRQVS